MPLRRRSRSTHRQSRAKGRYTASHPRRAWHRGPSNRPEGTARVTTQPRPAPLRNSNELPMARHARRGQTAPRLEVLEPRALLSASPPGASIAAIRNPTADILVRFSADVPEMTIASEVAAAGGRTDHV